MEKDINSEILERLVRLETKLDNYNGLREKLDLTAKNSDIHYERIKQLDTRMTKIEDGQKWLWRTIGGALIVSFLATYIMWR
jgi:hypothetical protein